MENIYVINIGFTLTEIFAQSVFVLKKDAIKALKDNKYEWSKSDRCFVNIDYPLTQCATIEKFKLNEFNQ